MNCGILHDLPAVVVYELIAKRGDIDGERQGEDKCDPPPCKKTRGCCRDSCGLARLAYGFG
jgi:hypothetical protein